MEGEASKPAKKTKREGKHACQVGYCPGSVEMDQIPSGCGGATMLMAPPFNCTKTDIDNVAGVPLFVCRSHLQLYAPGSSNGYVVMHPISDDHIVKSMLNGDMRPQPDYFTRTKQTYVAFLTELQARVDRAKCGQPFARAPDFFSEKAFAFLCR